MASPADSQKPSAPRRTVRIVLSAIAVMVLLTLGICLYLRGPGGIKGRVQAILSDVRREEKRYSGFSPTRGVVMQAVEGLLEKVLPSRQWQGEYYYREQLVGLGTNAIPELLRAIETDRSASARKISALALGELAGKEALPALGRALSGDRDASVREAAAEALTSLHDTNSLPALFAALRLDKEPNVRSECARAVATVGGMDILPELIVISTTETNNTVRERLAEQLGELPDQRSVPVLAGWIRTPRPEVEQPTNIDFPPAIISGMNNNDDTRVASAAATALGKIGGDDAFGVLMAQWGSETNTEVRNSLCEALGSTGDPRALPILLAALREGSVAKTTAAKALGNLGDTNAVTDLLPLLSDEDKEVRAKTAEALGQIGTPSCVAELMRVADEDFVTEVRLGACAALGKIGDPAAQDVLLRALPQLGENRQEAVWALGHVGDTNAIQVLAELLDDKQRETRFAAAYALAEIGGTAAADAVAAHMEDKDQYARHGKACALAMLGRTNGLTEVRAGLRAEELWRRFGAALALIRLGTLVDAKEWTPMHQDRSAALQRLAESAAAGRGIPALTELLRERDNDLRHYTARGLAFFKDPATLSALREACHDRHPDVRNAARTAVQVIERSSTHTN